MDFRVLGPLEVRSDGVPLSVPGGRQQRILASLLLNVGRVVSVSALTDAVWDGEPPASAGKQVRNGVSALRSWLAEVAGGPPPVSTVGSGYRIELAGNRLDADEFVRHRDRARRLAAEHAAAEAVGEYRAALALWRGGVLDGLAGDVLAGWKVGLDEQRLTAVEECLDLEIKLGRPDVVIGELSEWLAGFPTRERLVGLLLRALDRSGRTSEAVSVYQRFRRRLADETGLDPGAEVTAAYQELLRHDPPRTAPRGPLPRQLPAAVSHFTGRDPELTALDRLLTAGRGSSLLVSAVAGAAGVGKTALAVYWAHRVRDRFRDGQLYLDLRGYGGSGEPVAAGDALDQILRAFGVTDGEHRGVEERSALYRSLLAQRSVLVVLDNVRSAAQVRPLLPGPGPSVAVITSRSQLTGLVARDGVARVTLDLLSAPDSLTLLGRLTGPRVVDADPWAAAELVEQCGRLPLALRLAGERVASSPGRTLAEVVSELTDRHGRLDALDAGDDDASAVRAVFSWSYQALAGPSRRLFRLLAVATGADLGVPAAAALADLDPVEVRPLLNALSREHLITGDAADRYRMHDLLRAYGQELALAEDGPGLVAAAQNQLAAWYLHTARPARIALAPNLPDLPVVAARLRSPPLNFTTSAEALGWCEQERSNVVATTLAAARRGEHALAWQLATAMYGYFDLGKHWTDWISTHQAARASAQALGDKLAEGKILCNLGNAYRPQRRFPQALECYQRALRLFAETGYRQGEAKVLGNVASAHHESGDLDRAVAASEVSLRIFQELGDQYGAALTLSNLGNSYAQQDRLERAADCQHRALALFGEVGDEHGTARPLAGLGDIERLSGRLDTAVDYYQQAVELFGRHGDRYEQANTLVHLGRAHVAGGRLGAARDCWRQALSIYRALRDRAGEERLLAHMSRADPQWQPAAPTRRGRAAAPERGLIRPGPSPPRTPPEAPEEIRRSL